KAYSVAELLTGGDWYQSENLVDWDGDGIFEDVALPCENGNIWFFAPDGSCAIKDMDPVCDTDIPNFVIPGTWMLLDNNTKLRIDLSDGFYATDFQIVSIDPELLEINIIDLDAPSAQVKEKIILRRP
ncbi:hypothetical protein HUU05_28500, partial [candidate division KSB1 bacterium]|nr:hypothetical protein [candidate division KSB1 bacterium]